MKKSGLKHLRVFSRNIPYHNFGNSLDVVFLIKRRIIFFFKHKKRENANQRKWEIKENSSFRTLVLFIPNNQNFLF